MEQGKSSHLSVFKGGKVLKSRLSAQQLFFVPFIA